jgi:serine/threonine-protein kinase
MGEVYLAHDRKTDQDVALKTLHGKYSANRAAVSRFVREVTLTRQMDHPGIVRLHETHNWNGTLLYTMDYVEGKTLRRWLSEKKRLDFGSAVRVLCLVADVLEHAHKITIHRDLSPENIMVLADGSVRLLDFGLAKLDDKFKGLTMVGANLGKLMYMAPEQELDAGAVDYRADLYSLGVILFELLVGRTPLPGRKLRDFRPDLPPEIDDFLKKALARRPDDRFGSAREFRDALLQLYKLHTAREAGVHIATASPGIAARIRGFFRRILRAR